MLSAGNRALTTTYSSISRTLLTANTAPVVRSFRPGGPTKTPENVTSVATRTGMKSAAAGGFGA